MRTLTADHTTVLALPHRAIHAKVEIDRTGSGDWVDMTSLYGFNWVVSWEYSDSVDAPTAVASFRFRQRHEYLALSPLDDNSKLNASGDIVFPYKKIRLYTATMPRDVLPSSGDWMLVFRGRIHDVELAGENIEAHCRDEGGDLMDIFTEVDRIQGAIGGLDVETVSQNILDAESTGVTLWSVNGDGTPAFDAGDSPSWAIEQYIQNKAPVLKIVTGLWEQLGWICKYRWQSTAADFKLVAYEPTRTGAAIARTFTSSQYYNVTSLKLSNADVRNVVRVVYKDASDIWQYYELSDATSITLYGRKFFEIAEEATSQINTSTEATAMATAALSDLKDPVVAQVIEMPYFWAAEIGDKYTFAANNVHYSSDQSLGLISVSHSGDARGAARTVMTCEGQPRGGIARWLEKQSFVVKRRFGAVNIDTNQARSGSLVFNSDLTLWSLK